MDRDFKEMTIRVDRAKAALADFRPADPVEYVEDDEGYLSTIYSDADAARLQQLHQELGEARHADAMRQFSLTQRSMIGQMEDRLTALRNTLIEAQANSDWDYTAPSNAEQRKFDGELVSQVRLDVQRVASRHFIDPLALINMTGAQLREVKEDVSRQMGWELEGFVYGYRHQPIETRATRTVTFEYPASWWQMFKRDVLRSKKVKMVTAQREVRIAVTVDRFSAFPELPFKASPQWGPRIDLPLPRQTMVYVK